jgi:hypothetical protein
MLRPMRALGVSVSLIVLLAAGAATAAPAPPPAGAPPPPPAARPPEPVKTNDQLKKESLEGAAMTPLRDLKKESLEGAAMTPLRDLNVVRSKIPNVLLEALADPYARPPRGWRCPQLVELVRPLDDALGEDMDRLPPGDEDLTERSREMALGTAVDLATGAIPFHGWIRKLSGAERHDKLVRSAIVAGDVRRAYLKGLGESKGCNPPATPSHERAGMRPVTAEKRDWKKPAYPTRMTPGAQQTAAGTPQAAPQR